MRIVKLFNVFICACAFNFSFNIAQSLGQNSSSESATFRALLTPKNVRRNLSITQYQTENGRDFIIDRKAGGEILLKFAIGSEVFALNSISGPRGDEFLRNDVGQTMVRITSLGGVTYYSKNDPIGKAAINKGKAAPIPPIESIKTQSVANVVENASTRFIEYDIPTLTIEVTGGLPNYLIKDALDRAADGLNDIPYQTFARRKISKLRINRAFQTFVMVQNGVIEIGLTPGIGYAGRPSSIAIFNAVTLN